MAPPPRTWADLPSDILTNVVDRLHHALQSYLSVRGVCAAWRSALPPEPPCLIVAGGVRHSPAAAFSCPFRLLTLPEDSRCTRARCIGACHGWVAIAYTKPMCFYGARTETPGSDRAEKQQPATDNNDHQPAEKKSYRYRYFQGARVQMDPTEATGYKNAGRPKRLMALFNPVSGRRIELPEHNMLDPSDVYKVVFAPNPRPHDFTVVAAFGFNSLAYITTRDGEPCWSFSVGDIKCDTAIADMVYREDAGGGGDKVFCLARSGGDVHVVHVPQRDRPTKLTIMPLLPGLLAGGRRSVIPADAFPPTLDTVSGILQGGKNLVFCNGEMYQVWCNTIGSVFHVPLPGAGRRFRTVREDEVFVLQYDASRRPCWRLAPDLGGHAVFVGSGNSAVAVRAGEVHGVKGDCVYWISRFGKRKANVFDMRTRTSMPFVSPDGGVGVPVCWYSPGGDAGSA